MADRDDLAADFAECLAALQGGIPGPRCGAEPAVIIRNMDRPSSKQGDEFNLAEELAECLAALPRLQAEARATETKKKAAWRAKNPEKDRSTARVRYAKNPEKDRAETRSWRAANPDKVRAQKRRETDANYFRPFVAIDSEGQNYPDDDIVYQEVGGPVRYARHDTYLWGAAADDGREPEWLTNGPDKQPLSVYKILDWLLSLPEKFGQTIFEIASTQDGLGNIEEGNLS
jgi:hypothetical protein